MQPIFWGLAIVAWISLLSGVVATSRTTIVLAASMTLLVHIVAGLFLGRLGKRATVLARSRGWPDWMAAQAEKGQRKALVYSLWGGLLVVAMVSVRGRWQGVIASACLAFHLGAFAAEGLLIAGQGRLWLDYSTREGGR